MRLEGKRTEGMTNSPRNHKCRGFRNEFFEFCIENPLVCLQEEGASQSMLVNKK
jgi:hypothetical protein